MIYFTFSSNPTLPQKGRLEPLLDSTTKNVIDWVIGLRAWDDSDPANLTAYVDAQVPVPEDGLKPLADWTEDEIRAFAFNYAIKEEYTTDPDTGAKTYSKRNWFNQLRGQVEAMKGQPIQGSQVII